MSTPISAPASKRLNYSVTFSATAYIMKQFLLRSFSPSFSRDGYVDDVDVVMRCSGDGGGGD